MKIDNHELRPHREDCFKGTQKTREMDIGVTISQFLATVGVDNERADASVKKLASNIDQQEIKLLDLVKALGDYLTADDDLLRPKATQCLAATLDLLKKDILTPSDLAVLTSFFVSKLEDTQCLRETLYGLSSLIDMESFGPSNLKSVLNALLKDYESTKSIAATRHFGLLTLQNILSKFEKYIEKHMQQLFIECFVHVASGEKDPRNLLLSFAVNKQISSKFDIENFQDELFDMLFCYFPISFKPPKDDPYKITQEQLKQCLRDGISSSSIFAKDSYPNLIEKLTSTSPSVKRDVVETITQCISQYGYESIAAHWIELWNALKFEIIHGEEEDEEGVYKLVLSTFTEMAKQLSKEDEAFDKFINTLLKDLKDSFHTKTFKQTCFIFGAIARDNRSSYNKVINLIFSDLLKDAKELNIPKQRDLINNIGVFTTAYLDVYGSYESPKLQDYNNTLKLFKDEILIILGKSLMGSSHVEVSLRTLAITELTKLTTLNDFLLDSEMGLVAQYFTETVLTDDNEYVFQSAIGGLVQLSKVDAGLLLEVTLPTLVSLLPDQGSSSVRINDEDKPKEKIFNIINEISTNSTIVNFMMIRLLNKLESIQSTDDSGEYSYLIVSTLQRMIFNSQQNKQFQTDAQLTKSFNQLVKLLVESPLLRSDDNVLESSTEILKLLVVYSNKSLHQQLLDETMAVFTGTTRTNCLYYKDVPSLDVFEQPHKLINVLLKVLAGVDKSAKLNNADALINSVISIIKTHEFDDVYVRISYLRLLSLLVNKWCTDSSKYESLPLDTTTDIEEYAWIARGVILKIDERMTGYIDRLVSLLSDEQLGSVVTKAFEVLVVEMSIFEKYKKITNNNVRLLYKQRFFQIVTPELVDGFTRADDLSVKSNYLSALSMILKHTKREIITPHLSSFFPLLLQSLSLPNSEVRLASLQTILSSVGEISDLVSSHLSTLVPKLLSLLQMDPANTAPVRLVAVNCLHSFSIGLPLEKMVPYQKDIIKALTPVLDDKKRSVRKGAVDTRQAYFELGRNVDY